MTLDNDSWHEFFDELNSRGERLKAAVTLARVPLSPARARRPEPIDARGGLLEEIRFDRERNEIQVAICQNGTGGASVRYFVSAPRLISVDDLPCAKSSRSPTPKGSGL